MAGQRKAESDSFLPDQQRADTLAWYGGVKVHAPNLNKLASESIIFEQTYVTHPVCTPSRSSLMTGTWPHINGCIRNSVPLDRRFRVFPELMEDKDYRTAYMGKWHLGEEGPAGRGFHEWISTDDRGDYTNYLISRGITPDKPNGRFSELAISNLPFELSRPKFLERHACIFTEKHQRDPFVLVVGFVEPHWPYNGPLNDEHPLDEIDLDDRLLLPIDEKKYHNHSKAVDVRRILGRIWDNTFKVWHCPQSMGPDGIFVSLLAHACGPISFAGGTMCPDRKNGSFAGFIQSEFGLRMINE